MAVTGLGMKSKPLDQVRADVPVGKVMKGELVRLNLNMMQPTRTRWKHAALDLNMDLTTLIHEAVEAYLQEHLKK